MDSPKDAESFAPEVHQEDDLSVQDVYGEGPSHEEHEEQQDDSQDELKAYTATIPGDATEAYHTLPAHVAPMHFSYPKTTPMPQHFQHSQFAAPTYYVPPGAAGMSPMSYMSHMGMGGFPASQYAAMGQRQYGTTGTMRATTPTYQVPSYMPYYNTNHPMNAMPGHQMNAMPGHPMSAMPGHTMSAMPGHMFYPNVAMRRDMAQMPSMYQGVSYEPSLQLGGGAVQALPPVIRKLPLSPRDHTYPFGESGVGLRKPQTQKHRRGCC